jgi:hypothetical protein
MTREALEAVVDALVGVVDSWNGAAADEDRGRSNDAICLTLYDDGSGTIGRRHPGGSEVEDWHQFDTFNELVEKLRDGEGVEVEDDAPAAAGQEPSEPAAGEEAGEWACVLPFLTTSKPFAHGVEVGCLWEQLKSLDRVEGPFHRANQDQILLMLSRLGWTAEKVEPVDEFWFQLEARKPKE